MLVAVAKVIAWVFMNNLVLVLSSFCFSIDSLLLKREIV